ncbi:MAG TPA: NAD(P)-dependent oxidoreductase [Burkholderiales bacterium]|nr:NAD(P)-dependent oxidoreductase [Burkholderiales bacterium]
MAQNKFRVGITRDNLKPDGKPIFDAACLKILDDPRIEYEFLPQLEPELTPQAAARYDALAVMLAKVTRATVSGPDRRVKLIARFGVGYDTVDVPALTDNGVLLTITPDGVRRPVATAALTLVLMLAQKVPTKDRLVREGRWAERMNHFGTGLSGRTLGSIGVGNIGSELFRLAMPFAMRHIACDPYVTQESVRPLGVTLVDLDTLFREADFLCVNCPLNEETRKLVGARQFALMKPTACFVNTARGPIVDEKALYQTLAAGRIAGAGIDVFEQEPTPQDNPLLELDNIVVTPHHICLTDECIATVAASVFNACRDLAYGRVPRNVVNQQVLGRVPYFHA